MLARATVASIGALALMVACGGAEPVATDVDGGSASHDAAPVPVDAPPRQVACSDRGAQPVDATWTVAGRHVEVHVPASYDPELATPLVLNLHGLTSSGADLIEHSRMLPVADARGFIAIHPDGSSSPRSWNAGDCCDGAAASGVDDVAFLAAVLDEAEARLCVDPRRIYAAGFSNGAFMAYRLACELADRIAAIGPVSGQLGIDDCAPSRPVPVMHVHGTSDLIVAYDGDGFVDYRSVDETLGFWTARDGCAEATTTTYDQGDATCVTYTGCDDGADVVRCTIDGGGHQWPGGTSTGVLGGMLSDDLDASAALWAFFAAHPLPS
ncbi:MAG: PHB depolymerase family esterase [Kofleriaceae bacterium]